jgi:hypothetical protein
VIGGRLASVDPERDCSTLTAQLSEACAVVDVLEPFVRDELTGQICNREMTAYTQARLSHLAFPCGTAMKKLRIVILGFGTW